MDSTHATTVWRRVATAQDPGSAVRLSSGGYSKVAMTLVAYRGVSTTEAIAVVTGTGEPGSTAVHTTPTVASDTNGAWRVSYW